MEKPLKRKFGILLGKKDTERLHQRKNYFQLSIDQLFTIKDKKSQNLKISEINLAFYIRIGITEEQ